MNGLEVFGVIFCVILGVIFMWFIGYLICGDDLVEDERMLGAFLLTTVVLVIILVIAITSYIESDRKNDEYKKIISEYEADMETGK